MPKRKRTLACIVGQGIYGRGVIAYRDIAEGEVFEVAPMMAFYGDASGESLHQLGLIEHVYEWRKGYGLAFGVGSFFNHSLDPNAMYILRIHRKEMDYVAL